MGRLLARPRLRTALVGLGLLCAALALVIWPAQSADAVREGMALCANVVVPALFPFFVLASLVVELGLSRCLGRLLHPIMAPLFRVNGSCAAALHDARIDLDSALGKGTTIRVHFPGGTP